MLRLRGDGDETSYLVTNKCHALSPLNNEHVTAIRGLLDKSVATGVEIGRRLQILRQLTSGGKTKHNRDWTDFLNERPEMTIADANYFTRMAKCIDRKDYDKVRAIGLSRSTVSRLANCPSETFDAVAALATAKVAAGEKLQGKDVNKLIPAVRQDAPARHGNTGKPPS